MVCTRNCVIASGFIGSSIFMALNMDKCQMKKAFMDSLDTKQQLKYESIIEERKKIYIQGYIIGLIVSMIVVGLNYSSEMLSRSSLVCTIVMITSVVNYFYYTMAPKSDYMLLHLKNPEQNKRWLDIYKTMKMRCHVGFAIGIIGAGILGTGLCKSK